MKRIIESDFKLIEDQNSAMDELQLLNDHLSAQKHTKESLEKYRE